MIVSLSIELEHLGDAGNDSLGLLREAIRAEFEGTTIGYGFPRKYVAVVESVEITRIVTS